jgi:hypothetical protein
LFATGAPAQASALQPALRSIILRENILGDKSFIYNTPSILTPFATDFRIVPVDSGVAYSDPSQTLTQAPFVMHQKQALILDVDQLERPLSLDQETHTMPMLISATTLGTHYLANIATPELTLQQFLMQAFGKQKPPVTKKEFTIGTLICKNYASSNIPLHHNGPLRIANLVVSKKKDKEEPWKATFVLQINGQARQWESYFKRATDHTTWRCPDLDEQLLAALKTNDPQQYQRIDATLSQGASVETQFLLTNFFGIWSPNPQDLSFDRNYVYKQLQPQPNPDQLHPLLRNIDARKHAISLLSFAILARDTKLAQLALNHHANARAISSIDGSTPLHLCTYTGDTAMGQLLVQHDHATVNAKKCAGRYTRSCGGKIAYTMHS